MNKINLAVFFGGMSSEHNIALNSASCILKNLSKKRFNVFPVGITEDGRWLFYPGPFDGIVRGDWFKNSECREIFLSPEHNRKLVEINKDKTFKLWDIDCVFPVIHGANGEDGRIQGLCELAGVPYVGCDVASSANCMDKTIAHRILDSVGIKGTKWIGLYGLEVSNDLKIYDKVVSELGFPIFTKPARSGSSVGMKLCNSLEELREGVKYALKYDDKIICEAAVEGMEVECALYGNSNPKASTLGQINPHNVFYDYESKYEVGSELIIPAQLSDEVSNRVKVIARKAYRAMGCSGLARVDFFVTDDNDIYLNEINTFPGFNEISMYPKLWKYDGIDIESLLSLLVDLAIDKKTFKIYM